MGRRIGNDDFSAAVEKVLSLINEYAGRADGTVLAEMTYQFREGVRFEYEFWNDLQTSAGCFIDQN